MLLPNLMSAILQRVDFSVTMTAWFIGVILMVTSMYVGNCFNSITFFGFGSFYMLLSARESNRCRIEIETRSKNEIQLLSEKAENERKEAENSANELRHMIANVAHDFKTVSSLLNASFM